MNSTTKTKAATKTNGKATANGKASKPVNDNVDIRRIDISKVDPDPRNRDIKTTDLAKLKASIASKGQVVPALVRPAAKGRFTLVIGERRWQCCKDLKVGTLLAEVRELDDAQALELMAIENAEREDLNDIQKAQLIEKLCANVADGGAGLTRKAAAERVGLKTGQAASNLVRLLTLPKWAVDMINDGSLLQTYARELAKFPTEILAQKAFEKEFKLEIKRASAEGDTYGRESFIDYVCRDPLSESTRSFEKSKSQYDDGRRFEPSDADREKLGVVTLNIGVGYLDGEYATNVKLFDKLQSAAVNATEKAKTPKASDAATEGMTAKQLAAHNKKVEEQRKAEQKAKQQKQAQQFKNATAEFKRRFRRWWLAEAVYSPASHGLTPTKANAIALRVVLAFVLHANRQKLDAVIKVAFNNSSIKFPKSGYGWLSPEKIVTRLIGDDAKLSTVSTLAAELLFPGAGEPQWLYIDDDFIVEQCSFAGFDPVQAWDQLASEPTSEKEARALFTKFFSIHPTTKLAELVGSYEFATDVSKLKTKTSMIEFLTSDDGSISCPEILRSMNPKAKGGKK